MTTGGGLIYLFAYEEIIAGFMKRKGERRLGSIALLETWERYRCVSREEHVRPFIGIDLNY